jgi:hypothetical protein
MPTVTIPDELHAKISQFQQVVEAILEESLTVEQYVRLLLERGVYSMLNDIIGEVSPETLQESFQQLGARYPAEVYGYVAERIKRGALETARERLRRQIGFRSDRE